MTVASLIDNYGVLMQSGREAFLYFSFVVTSLTKRI
jgi:hypothetical protein